MSFNLFHDNLQRWYDSCPEGALQVAKVDCSSTFFSPSSNGDLNLKKTVNGEELFFHSLYNPHREAVEWFSQLYLKNINVLYIYGIGLGYYYDAVKEWLNENHKNTVIFLEDDLEVIHRFLETDRAEAFLKDEQAMLFFLEQTNEGFLRFSKILAIFSQFKEHTTALDFYKRYYAGRFNLIQKEAAYISSMFGAEQSEYNNYSLFFFHHFYRNMLHLPGSYFGDSLFGRFTNMPAIVCGAGPSLEKNIEVLKTLKNKAIIFGGGTAMNALNAFGMLPHFGLGIDPNPDHFTRLLINHAYETPFFFHKRMSYDAVQMIHGDRIYLTGATGYEIAPWLEKKVGIEGKSIPEGYNVVNYSLSIAQAMGCNPIILVGVDLAYSNNQSYSSGMINHPIYDQDRKSRFRTKSTQEDLIPAKDIYGNPVNTLWKWVSESTWISNFASNHPDIAIINSTEGGLGFLQVPNIPLADVAQQLLQKNYDFEAKLHGEIQNCPLPENLTVETVKQALLDLKTELHSILEKFVAIMSELENFRKTILEEDDAKIENVRKKVLEQMEELFENEIFIRFFKIFHDHFLKTHALELYRVKSKKDNPLKKEGLLKKVNFNKEKFLYLIEGTKLHSSFIDLVIKEHEKIIIPKKITNTPTVVFPEKTDTYTYAWENEVLTIIDPELGLTFQEKFNPDLIHGRHQSYYSEGALKEECFYLEGVLHGPSTFYNADGRILARNWFYKGLLQGKSWRYYPSGTLHSLQRFKDNLKEGKQEYYYPDGSVKSILHFSQGKLHGDVLLYYPNGHLFRSLHFIQDKRDGIELIYNEEGLQIIEAEYKENRPYGKAKRWHPNGTLMKETVFDENSKMCTIHEWNEAGEPLAEKQTKKSDYFDEVAEQTDHLTSALEQIFSQFLKVVPALAKKREDGSISEEISELNEKMEKLRDLNKILQNESDKTVEPVWKTPSMQRLIEKNLSDMNLQMTEELFTIQNTLNDLVKQIPELGDDLEREQKSRKLEKDML